MEVFERDLAEHLALLRAECADALREQFRAESWVRVGRLLPQSWEHRAREEARALLERCGVRRDVRIAQTGNSPRRLCNVRQSEIAAGAQVLPALYYAEATRRLVSCIAGNDVQLCPFEPERFVLQALSRVGDTHGWHWDDYAYALVHVIEVPPDDAGGAVEYLPGVPWEKSRPRIAEHLAAGSVRVRRPASGEAYLLRSDTTLHRVAPLERDATRVAYAMAYAHADDLARPITHETTEELYRRLM